MASIFFSYSHADELLRDQLAKHLAILQRQGLIETWHDRRIKAGDNIDHLIMRELELSDVILLLVSSDFLASDYCYDVEMQRAMARQEAGEARVIPVILRHCGWHDAPFGKLNATPKDGKPIRSFSDVDEGFLQVVQAIKNALLDTARHPKAPPRPAPLHGATPGPSSRNLSLPKHVTDFERDRFREETFDFMAEFFANSLRQLQANHQEIQGAVRRIDAQNFTVTVYRGGEKKAFCRIFIGFHDKGIAYSTSDYMGTNSMNESLSVGADEAGLFLKPLMGMSHYGGKRLKQEEAAEVYWERFIEPLRQR